MSWVRSPSPAPFSLRRVRASRCNGSGQDLAAPRDSRLLRARRSLAGDRRQGQGGVVMRSLDALLGRVNLDSQAAWWFDPHRSLQFRPAENESYVEPQPGRERRTRRTPAPRIRTTHTDPRLARTLHASGDPACRRLAPPIDRRTWKQTPPMTSAYCT